MSITLQALLRGIAKKDIPESMTLESIQLIPTSGLGDLDVYGIKVSFSGCFRDIDGNLSATVPDDGNKV